MKRRRADRKRRFAAITMLLATSGAQAQDTPAPSEASAMASLAGDYVHSEMELVAGIRLNADGSFVYGLTVGSLDESARGRWKATGNRIELTSDPRPVPPRVTAGQVETGTGAPFAIRLRTPGGRDVPGVDFRIEFDSGEPILSYMPGGPWSLPEDEPRTPRFITFSMPPYRLQSPRLPLDAQPGHIANFVLTPNDFGVADLTGVWGEIEGRTLTLHRPEGTMRFERAGS